jgi:membrane-associated phospholipid phosphatase
MTALGVLAIVAVATYALLWVGFAQHWGWLAAIDSAALDPLHDYGVKHPGWVLFWDVVCTVLGPESFRIVGAGVVIIAVLRRNLRVALFVLICVGLSGLVTELAKYAADRPRPAGALDAVSMTSFPSGHALESMAAVLVLLTISAGTFGRRGRTLSIAAGVLMVVVVGVGRVVVNVHYPTDVVAGWALGYLWYLCCLLLVRPLPLAGAASPDAEPIGEAADETPQAPDT